MSDLADKLAQALNEKENDINRWMWRLSNGTEVRMMDLNPEQMRVAYSHVNEMLYNKDPYHPGVVRKQDQIRRLWDAANAELLLRYILYTCDINGLKTNKDLLDYINAHKKENSISNSDSVTTIFVGLPEEFKSITIDMLLSACLDSLPAFNRKLLSDKFILSLGIWLTEDEKKELTDYDEEGKFRSRKEVIKERLFLNPSAEIRFDSKGLSFHEFRALLKIEGRPKFSTLSTESVQLLRNKVLLLLDQDVEYRIQKWEDIKRKLETVAEQKCIKL